MRDGPDIDLQQFQQFVKRQAAKVSEEQGDGCPRCGGLGYFRTEIEGYISDRLQEALWREALHMVANGDATVEQIDLAIVNGPGPRWAVMGPCMAS